MPARSRSEDVEREAKRLWIAVSAHEFCHAGTWHLVKPKLKERWLKIARLFLAERDSLSRARPRAGGKRKKGCPNPLCRNGTVPASYAPRVVEPPCSVCFGTGKEKPSAADRRRWSETPARPWDKCIAAQPVEGSTMHHHVCVRRNGHDGRHRDGGGHRWESSEALALPKKKARRSR